MAPMKLILLRHGIAVDRSTGLADADRPLTDVGVKKTRRAMAGLAQLIDRPDIILTSPKLRAAQTAQIAATALTTSVLSLDVLASGGAQQVIDELSRRDDERVVAVGHEPTFSEIVELLCFGQTTSSVELKKAGCACLQTHGKVLVGHGSLQWLVTPKMLRQLGK